MCSWREGSPPKGRDDEARPGEEVQALAASDGAGKGTRALGSLAERHRKEESRGASRRSVSASGGGRERSIARHVAPLGAVVVHRAFLGVSLHDRHPAAVPDLLRQQVGVPAERGGISPRFICPGIYRSGASRRVHGR